MPWGGVLAARRGGTARSTRGPCRAYFNSPRIYGYFDCHSRPACSLQMSIRRQGFTLIEALVATAITAVAGSALLLGVVSSVNSTRFTQEQVIADGLAAQLMDEIAGKAFSQTRNVTDVTLGPTGAEMAAQGRSGYTDIGDYNGLRNSPPKDMWNVPLGKDAGSGITRESVTQVSDSLSTYRQEVDVYYVNSTDLQTPVAAGQTSNFKCVEVRILVNDPNGAQRVVAKQKRVFANVPSL